MLLSVGLTQMSLARALRSFSRRDFHAPATQASRMCAIQIVQHGNEGANRKFRQELRVSKRSAINCQTM